MDAAYGGLLEEVRALAAFASSTEAPRPTLVPDGAADASGFRVPRERQRERERERVIYPFSLSTDTCCSAILLDVPKV